MILPGRGQGTQWKQTVTYLNSILNPAQVRTLFRGWASIPLPAPHYGVQGSPFLVTDCACIILQLNELTGLSFIGAKLGQGSCTGPHTQNGPTLGLTLSHKILNHVCTSNPAFSFFIGLHKLYS